MASADENGTCGENVTWSFEESTGTLTIKGSGPMTDYTSSSRVPWYASYNKKITTVVIEEGVTSIGECAFNNCQKIASVTIPSTVTSIGSYSFRYCPCITTISIPNGVTSIGSQVFEGCEKLSSIVIPNSVKSIGSHAFKGCSNLSSVSINTETIGSWFRDISSIKEVTIGDNVSDIGENAFYCCTGISSISLPNNVTSIGKCSFYGCTSLLSISMSKSLTNIGELAFGSCYQLSSMTIPSSVTSIGNSAFSGCSSLASVNIQINDLASFCNNTIVYYLNKPVCLLNNEDKEIKNLNIPEGVTSIGNFAFSGCSGLSSISIPNSVTSIGQYAFHNCMGLTSLTIPNSVTTIGQYAFNGMALKTFIVGTGLLRIDNTIFSTQPIKTIWLTNTPPQGYRYANGTVNYVANNQYSGLNNLKEYKFLSSMFDVNGVKYVPVSPSDRTCDAIDCVYDESVKEVNINATVSYKGVVLNVLNVMPYSFYQNNNLHKISFDIAGNIGKYVFFGCQSLKTATLGTNITGIDEYAFSGCSKLESIIVPNSVKTIGQYAFSECTSLKSVVIGNGTKLINQYTFFNCSNLITAVVGSGTRSIMHSAFAGCSALPRIIIPNTINYIGYYVFSGCNSLKEVIMNDRDNSIMTRSFDDWNVTTTASKAIEVTVGDTLSFNYNVSGGNIIIEIPNEGSYSDYGIRQFKRTISYPGTVTITFEPYYNSNSTCIITNMKLIEGCDLTLGSNDSKPLFTDCPLDSVYIGRNISYNKSSNYGYSPFYRNTSLCSVVITGKEEEISENEFYGCTNLKNVQIGDGVTTIGNWAFSGCASLQHFAFGTQVKTIGKEAFSDCTAVTAIISKAQAPPTCDSQALDDINKWTCSLTVPKGCKNSYAAADQWKEFFFVEEGDGSGQQNPDTADSKKCETPTISYSNGLLTFTCGTEGATCMSTIKDTDITSYTTNEVQLSVTYTVSVYAMLAGYEDSDIATATLCWIDQLPATEGTIDGIANVPAKAVLIQSNDGQLIIEGANDGERISVYSINGSQVGSAVSNNGSATISTNLQFGSVAIVKIGEKSVKIVVE